MIIIRIYNYKKLERQLKEQFIHGLNDTDMLGKIIQELTKIKENENKPQAKMCNHGQRELRHKELNLPSCTSSLMQWNLIN